jgi:hypothetical protein
MSYYIVIGAIIGYTGYKMYQRDSVGISLYNFIFGKEEIHNRNAFVEESHVPSIEITHITEDSAEIRKYIQKWLEHLYLDNEESSEHGSDSSYVKLDNSKNYDNQRLLETKIDEILDSPKSTISEILEDLHKVPESLKQGHDKIYVEFALNNEKYAICVKSEFSEKDKTDGFNSGLKRKILSAYLKSDQETIDVSNLMKEFQGPEHNFYSNLNGPTNKWSDILYPYDLSDGSWTSLEINDLFGDQTSLNISELDTVEWNSSYKL